MDFFENSSLLEFLLTVFLAPVICGVFVLILGIFLFSFAFNSEKTQKYIRGEVLKMETRINRSKDEEAEVSIKILEGETATAFFKKDDHRGFWVKLEEAIKNNKKVLVSAFYSQNSCKYIVVDVSEYRGTDTPCLIRF